jgi:hypothetical protein
MKYIFIVFALTYFVYFAPALAIYPKLITKPLSFVISPLISAFIIYLVVTVDVFLECFTPLVATGVAWGLGLIAFVRCFKTITTEELAWKRSDLSALFLIGLIVLPYFFKLGVYGFDRGDEIYSWNFWALQYVFHEAIDFSHTGAAYPQMLPKLLAFCYQFLDNTQLQLPIKSTLILFTYSLIGSIYFSIKNTRNMVLLFWVMLFYCLFMAGLERFFKDAYADPIMSSFLIASIASLYYSYKNNSNEFLVFSVLLAIGAFLSKQPAMLWAIFTLPLIIIIFFYKQEKHLSVFLIFTLLVSALLWFLTEGSTVLENRGVVILSFEGRSIWQQLPFSIYRHLIANPYLSALFLTAGYCSWNHKFNRVILLGFFVPSLLLWLIFGSYQLRLGQHLISISLFFILIYVASNKIKMPRKIQSLFAVLWLRKKYMAYSVCFLSLSLSSFIICKSLLIEKPGVSLYAGGKHSIYRNFGKDSELIYNVLYAPAEKKLWVPSRYLYGLFYKHAMLVSPEYSEYPYTQQILVQQLTSTRPDVVFTVSSDVIDGVANENMRSLIQQCPNMFTRLNYSENRFDFIAYKVTQPMSYFDSCLKG